MAVMGIAGEIAAEKSAGPGSLQVQFLDALYNLTAGEIRTAIEDFLKNCVGAFRWNALILN